MFDVNKKCTLIKQNNLSNLTVNLPTFLLKFKVVVLLYNDVPMEIVSKLLGHSSMKITQDSYGKIVQRKISVEMERLKG